MFNKKCYKIRTDLVEKANVIRDVNDINTQKRLNELAICLDDYEYFKFKKQGFTYIYYRLNGVINGITTKNK